MQVRESAPKAHRIYRMGLSLGQELIDKSVLYLELFAPRTSSGPTARTVRVPSSRGAQRSRFGVFGAVLVDTGVYGDTMTGQGFCGRRG